MTDYGQLLVEKDGVPFSIKRYAFAVGVSLVCYCIISMEPMYDKQVQGCGNLQKKDGWPKSLNVRFYDTLLT